MWFFELLVGLGFDVGGFLRGFVVMGLWAEERKGEVEMGTPC